MNNRWRKRGIKGMIKTLRKIGIEEEHYWI